MMAIKIKEEKAELEMGKVTVSFVGYHASARYGKESNESRRKSIKFNKKK